MILVMPENQSIERRQTMRAFGAELVLTPRDGGMELARDVAEKMRDEGQGIILDQFANPDNPLAHYEGAGPEIWRDTGGRITHFVSSMGTTGTIMGTTLPQGTKSRHPRRRLPTRGGKPDPRHPQAAGGLFAQNLRQGPVDSLEYVSQADAETITRRLARRRAFSPASPPAVRLPWPCASPASLKTRSSSR